MFEITEIRRIFEGGAFAVSKIQTVCNDFL